MTQPAVEYDHVGFSYPGQRSAALEGVSLAVASGERLGILGPNGGGKSTLVKLTLGLLGGFSGRISVLGRSPEQARREGLIGYVPQRSEARTRVPDLRAGHGHARRCMANPLPGSPSLQPPSPGSTAC